MPQFVRRTLDWACDAPTLFAPLQHRPWAMLLDSCCSDGEGHHPDARYDILVADPLATLVTRGAHTDIDSPDGHQRSNDDPLRLLQRALSRHLPSLTDAQDLPFIGGALGHFSYDLGRRFEHLPVAADDDINLPEMAVGLYDWALVLDQQLQRVELIVIGDELHWQRRYLWLQQCQQQPSAPFRLQQRWHHDSSRQQYLAAFERVQAYLSSGDCYQINLTQRFQAPYSGSEWQAYLTLRQHNQAPFSAFIRLPEATLLSVSPERFLQVQGDQVQTKPIKGTQPRSHDPLIDNHNALTLAHSEKDRAENLMIVDLLRNDLGRVSAPGSVQVPSLFAIESFPAVHHLVSTVTSTLADGISHCDLLRGAFPGGSITGAPKIRAMQIIEELEPWRRSLYCGSIGYLSCHAKMDTSITIRSLVATGQRLYCWAGGGIVADSRADAEYQECFDKLARILPVLEPEGD
ncbi:aminodeoxychorismate synthase component I [Ferrimonas sp. SCSIO 43195]|uniref:aminodeoxychorismate synthase component I n=1 Tax=Ferrimonas sp. SCSIO 43195 TaxID=2822844 RepID=UPI0020757E98|nr:aminodeoxychorismate synthase component I [Ferrimonas sp. SCSIO 43195]USD39021.1 aminodeoxychorismate synthase component I [Ferrimonas sp. SCSIO 43195]